MCRASREHIERSLSCGRIISWMSFQCRCGWSQIFRSLRGRSLIEGQQGEVAIEIKEN